MKFSSSLWIWSSILFVTCFIGPKSVEACDEAFKETLLDEFRSALLGDFKKSLLDEFKQILDTKMDLVNHRFDQSEYALKSVTWSVYAIEGEVEAITGRSSEGQLNIQAVKAMQENMTTQLVKIEDNLIEMKKVENDTFTEIMTMGNNTQQQIQNISESLEGYKEGLQIMNNETTEIIQKLAEEQETNSNDISGELHKIGKNLITVSNNSNDILQEMEQNIEKLNDSCEDILTKTITLGKDISLVKQITNGTSQEMTEKLKSELQIVSNPIMDINSQLATVINKAIILGEDINEVKDIIDDSSKAIKKQLVTVASEQDANRFKLTTKLDILEKLSGCPAHAGFFKMGASGQCFKYHDEPKISWTAAKAKCEAEGLVLAKPNDPLALRSYVFKRYGPTHLSWIGGRGVGSSVEWSRGNKTLGANNPMWASGHPGSRTSSSYCLMLLTNEPAMKKYPDTPYYMHGCTGTYPTICELLRE